MRRANAGIALTISCSDSSSALREFTFARTLAGSAAVPMLEIEAAKAAGDQGKVRHLEEELKGLQEFKAHHPEDSHDPTPLEVFCDLNPDAPECLVYDD
jgi:hypothetical protein